MPERDKFTPKPDLPLGKYRHYKGGEYELLTLACDEATHEWRVIYRALYDTQGSPEVWDRSSRHFMESVTLDNGDDVPRFEKVQPLVRQLNIDSYIRLSELLARCQDIKRAIKLPHGEDETDSHHAFSLALLAYNTCKQFDLNVDAERVVAYALIHDLLEIVTGDEVTLTLDEHGLAAKHAREVVADAEFRALFEGYPDLLELYDSYERLDSPEAATVFVLDKACTTWTHFHDDGRNLRALGVTDKTGLERWYHANKAKFKTRLRAAPPQEIYDVFEDSYQRLRDTLPD